ncbi:hypothetical protein pb186bvf_017938 [Paramecium bursaria]
MMKKQKVLPPIISPRNDQKKLFQANFRSMSQKIKQVEEQRPASDEVQQKATKSVRQFHKKGNGVIIRKISNTVRKTLELKDVLRFQNPGLRLEFMGLDEIQAQEVIKEEETSNEKTNRLLTKRKGEQQFFQSSESNFELSANPSFTEGKFIGSGQFGQVYMAQENKTGRIFAVKKINLKAQLDPEDLQDVNKEIELMRAMQHKNILRLVHHKQTEEHLLIYLEYMSQGNLTSLLDKYGPLPEITIKQYAQQILDALQYLHDQRVIHRDVKGANILVDANGVLKLADFGCSKMKERTIKRFKTEDGILVKSLRGSIPYMAPEVITQSEVGFAADIWSFGCTVLEMCTAKPPWSEYDFDNPIQAILIIGDSDEIPKLPQNINPDLKDFLLCCFQRDSTLRSTAFQLLQHPFLNQ